jgi:MFS family permease
MLKSKFIRDKNFLLLFFGNLVSGVGSRVYGFGISLFLLDLTGKAQSTAIYFSIWSIVIFVFAPIAATFTDRWKNKAKILYWMDYGRGFFYALTALLVYIGLNTGNQTLVLITVYSAVFFIGIQTAFFAPAVTALTPRIVEREELVSASSVMQITRSVQNIAGLLFGAILYVNFGIVVLMLINAISFILSAISEMFIKVKNTKEEEEHQRSLIRDIPNRVISDLKGSITYLFNKGKPILMITLIILISATLVSPWFSVGVPYMFKEYFTFDNFTADYLLASSSLVESIGVILMSMIVAQIAAKFKIYQLIRIGGLLFLIIGTTYYFVIKAYDVSIILENSFVYIFIGINFFAGMVNASINAPLSASMQKYIEPNMIGKVTTLIDSFGGVLYPITALIVGYLLDNVGLYQPILIMVLAMGLITLVAFKSKELKKMA